MSAERQLAVVEITADVDGVSAGVRKASSTLRKFNASVRKALTIDPKSLFTGVAGGAVGAAAGVAVVANEVYKFEDQLTRMAIGAGLSNQQMNEMRAAVDKVSSSTGMARDEVLGAGKALNALLGPAGASAEKMELVAKAAIASEESAESLAGVIFAVSEAFGVMDTKDQEKALSAFIEAGKAGSVPLNEMSVVLQQVGAQWAKVAGQGTDGAADLAAAIQAARGGFGSASEVGTGLRAFVGSLTQNAAKFKKAGIDLFDTLPDGSKRLKSIRTVLDQIGKSKLVKDPTKLQAAFGSSEALQFFEVLSKNRGKYEEIYELALKSNSVQTDSQKYLNSAAGQYAKSLNDVKQAVSTAFDPAFLKDFAMVLGGVLETIKGMIAGLRSLREGFEEFLGVNEQAEKNKALSEAPYQLAEQALMRGVDTRDLPELIQKQLGPDAYASLPEGIAGSGAKRGRASFGDIAGALPGALADAARLQNQRIARDALAAGLIDETGRLVPGAEARANEVLGLANTGQTAGERSTELAMGGFGESSDLLVSKRASAEGARQQQQLRRIQSAVEVTIKMDPNFLARAEVTKARNR